MLEPVTSAVQFALGHVKLASKSSRLGTVAVSAPTSSLPFLEGVSGTEVEAVSDSLNGSTSFLFTPGLWHTPLNVAVTARLSIALVFPTPWIAVEVQMTVPPLRVQIGALSPFAKCAPDGAAEKLTSVRIANFGADGRFG